MQEFIRLLNEATGKTYRLPTEAEWEYAARGGNRSQGYKYSGSDKLNDVAVYNIWKIYPVGTKSPNELGIYDMSGNVWEWCDDWYGKLIKNTIDPQGPSTGKMRVMRGGASAQLSLHYRVTRRNSQLPSGSLYATIGFRLAHSSN